MTRFNKSQHETTVKNHEGAKAYALTPEMQLYTLVVTSLFTDKFYESNDESLKRLRDLIAKVSPVFVAKLAVYAREKMFLRTIPMVLAVELARVHNGEKDKKNAGLVSKLVYRIVQRADEITELLAYYRIANGRKNGESIKLSKQIQKGIALAFAKFDEYQFGKYDRDGAIKLKDAMFIVHPKPLSDKHAELYKKIADDTLATPYTWETELSAKGNKAEVWNNLISSGKLGYMALLRNLRNMLDANVSTDSLEILTESLTDMYKVRASMQLPFRFLSAYREVESHTHPATGTVLEALETAVVKSAENIRGFKYDTTIAVACDVSGSMQTSISPRSKVQNYDVGLMLGMLLQNRCAMVVTGMFGDTYKTIQLPKNSVLKNVMELHRREGEVGYSTNGHLVLRSLLKDGVKADKVMIFTDCQMWDSCYSGDNFKDAWKDYKKENPASKLYIFDLAGHGTSMLSEKQQDVFTIAGWSDKVFEVLDALEKKQTALEHINKIELY